MPQLGAEITLNTSAALSALSALASKYEALKALLAQPLAPLTANIPNAPRTPRATPTDDAARTEQARAAIARLSAEYQKQSQIIGAWANQQRAAGVAPEIVARAEQSLLQGLNRVNTALQNQTDRLQVTGRATAGMVTQLGILEQRLQRLTPDANAFGAALEKAAQQGKGGLNQLNESVGNLKLQGAANALSMFGSTLQALTAPLVQFGRYAFDAAQEIDGFKARLTGLTGSPAAAEKKLADLRRLAQESVGVTNTFALQMYGSLKQLDGVSEQAVERLIKGFGKLNALDALPPDFSRNIVQIFSQGFEEQDIKQAVGASPQFRKILEQAFGTSDGKQLKALQKSGQLTAEAYIAGLSGAIENNPQFANVSERASLRFEKAFDRIKTAAAPIGTIIIEALEPALKFLAGLAEKASAFFQGLPAPAQKAVIALGGVLAALGGIVTAVAGVLAGVAGFAALGVSLALVAKISLIVVGTLAAISAATAALYLAWQNNWGGIRELVADVIATMQAKIAALQRFWTENSGTILKTANTALSQLKTSFGETFGAVVELARALWERIKIGLNDLQAFWARNGESIKAIVSAVWDTLKGLVQSGLLVIRGIIQVVTGLLKGDILKVAEGLKNIVGAWITWVKTVFAGLGRILFQALKTAILELIPLNQIWEDAGRQFGASFVKGFLSALVTGQFGAGGVIYNAIKNRLVGDTKQAIADAHTAINQSATPQQPVSVPQTPAAQPTQNAFADQAAQAAAAQEALAINAERAAQTAANIRREVAAGNDAWKAQLEQNQITFQAYGNGILANARKVFQASVAAINAESAKLNADANLTPQRKAVAFERLKADYRELVLEANRARQELEQEAQKRQQEVSAKTFAELVDQAKDGLDQAKDQAKLAEDSAKARLASNAVSFATYRQIIEQNLTKLLEAQKVLLAAEQRAANETQGLSEADRVRRYNEAANAYNNALREINRQRAAVENEAAKRDEDLSKQQADTQLNLQKAFNEKSLLLEQKRLADLGTVREVAKTQQLEDERKNFQEELAEIEKRFQAEQEAARKRGEITDNFPLPDGTIINIAVTKEGLELLEKRAKLLNQILKTEVDIARAKTEQDAATKRDLAELDERIAQNELEGLRASINLLADEDERRGGYALNRQRIAELERQLTTRQMELEHQAALARLQQAIADEQAGQNRVEVLERINALIRQENELYDANRQRQENKDNPQPRAESGAETVKRGGANLLGGLLDGLRQNLGPFTQIFDTITAGIERVVDAMRTGQTAIANSGKSWAAAFTTLKDIMVTAAGQIGQAVGGALANMIATGNVSLKDFRKLLGDVLVQVGTMIIQMGIGALAAGAFHGLLTGGLPGLVAGLAAGAKVAALSVLAGGAIIAAGVAMGGGGSSVVGASAGGGSIASATQASAQSNANTAAGANNEATYNPNRDPKTLQEKLIIEVRNVVRTDDGNIVKSTVRAFNRNGNLRNLVIGSAEPVFRY